MSASLPSPRLAGAFSNAGHFLFHYFSAMYFTIVLAIERDWQTPYATLMELWFPASLLIGLGALPAGRLADKWSSAGMLVIMFLGMGLATIACSFVDTGLALMIFLGGLGLFGAIYHPVGIPWVIRTSAGNPGMRLAINGIFGGLGSAAAALITGWLIELLGWRGAFLLPGVICTLLGLAMWWSLASGRIRDVRGTADSGATRAQKGGNLTAVVLMIFPMFLGGLIYNTVQNAMPKLFEERMIDLLSGQIGLVGTAVGVVYGVGAIMQLLGGILADRYALKKVYFSLWLLQAPILYVLASYSGIPLGLAAMALTMVGSAILAPENLMLSRFAPADHQGLTFGLKFVVAFGAAPLGLYLITVTREATGEFTVLLIAYAVCAALITGVIAMLPASNRPQSPTTEPLAAD